MYDDFEDYLAEEYRIFLKYHPYEPWEYDRRAQAEKDDYLQGIMRGMDAAPLLKQDILRSQSSIFLCGVATDTHFSAGMFFDISTQQGFCSPDKREIILARTYREESWKPLTSVKYPVSIIAHEQGHIINSELGKLTSNDDWGEIFACTSECDDYARQCLEADDRQALITFSGDLQKVFTPRAGLLSSEEDPTRDDAEEIICDLVSFKLRQSKTQTARDMQERYPLLNALVDTMILAVQSKERIAQYRAMADQKTSMIKIIQSFGGVLPLSGPAAFQP